MLGETVVTFEREAQREGRTSYLISKTGLNSQGPADLKQKFPMRRSEYQMRIKIGSPSTSHLVKAGLSACMLCKIHSVAGGTGHEETGALVGSLAKGHPTVGRVRNTRKKMAFGGFGGFAGLAGEWWGRQTTSPTW